MKSSHQRVLLSLALFMSMSGCSDDKKSSGPTADCDLFTLAGLDSLVSERENARICVSVYGELQFRKIEPRCPGGGWYLSDSTGGPLYLDSAEQALDPALFPEDTSLRHAVVVTGDWIPSEKPCAQMLCPCQVALHVRSIDVP